MESALAQILESEQFRRSQRSRLFLQSIVRKALAGDIGSLKERILGIELFRRDPSFDTDRDAVVRVAANDVRNRLHDFYSKNPEARIYISLPAGHYVPTIEVRSAGASDAPAVVLPQAAEMPAGEPSAQLDSAVIETAARKLEAPVIAADEIRAAHGAAHPVRWNTRLFAGATVVLVVVLAGVRFWDHRNSAATHSFTVAELPPWSQLITPNKRLNLVLADANLVAATVSLGKKIPIEEYASHKFNYLPGGQGQFEAYLNQIPLTTVSDATIATRIAELVTRAGGGVQVMYSNRLDISHLKGEEPLMLVGSETSNPWVQLFDDRLNFQIVHNFDNGMDICINRRPQAGEAAIYTPRRNPAGVSEGYALIALIPNLTGKAKVLIVAGTSTEATEAAGDFVVNSSELSAALKTPLKHISSPKHLELLIKTSFVSGAAARSELLAYRVE